MKPTFEKTSIEIEKINAEIERNQREMKQAVDQVNIEKKIMVEKSLQKETLGRQVSNVEVIITLGLKLSCYGFSSISYYLERLLIEHTEQICSFFIPLCFIKFRSRK